MDALDALRLLIEWGADEALDDAPTDRSGLPEPATPSAPPSAVLQQSDPGPSDGDTARSNVAAPAPAERVSRPAAAMRAEAIAAGCSTLDELRVAVGAFDGCALSTTATNLVFADGNPAAGLMLVGEGPGAEEDRAGRPFVGPSGQLLDRMLASIGLDRTQLLMTNLIPWRPPGNRNPTDAEVVICLPFLWRHIALARPRRLVLLGSLASQALLGGATGVRRVRGRWVDVPIPGMDKPLPTLPMLHPAYLMRTPGAKKDAWSDLITLRRALDADRE